MNRKDNSHLTAMRRGKLSAPMRTIIRMEKDLRVGSVLRCLDYGCGHGDDARELGMEMYDPHWFPEMPKGKFDIITCIYVLNTISKAKGEAVLKDIKKRLNPGGRAYIVVRRDVKGKWLTQRGTYQHNVVLKLPMLRETAGHAIYKIEKG